MTILILANAINAAGFPLGKYLLEHVGPVFLTSARLLFGGVLLLLFEYLFMPNRKRIERKDFLIFLFTAFIFFTTMTLGAWGLQYAPAANASFFYNLSPFITAIFSYFFLHEIMTMKKWIGLVIGFLGFIPVLLLPEGGPSLGVISWPDVALIGSVITLCLWNIISRYLTINLDYSAYTINSMSTFFGGIFACIATMFIEHNFIRAPLQVNDYVFFIGLAISGLVANTLTTIALKTYTATFASFVAFIMPLFAALYGWLFLGEKIANSFYVSSVAVFIGLYIFYQEELSQGYVKKIRMPIIKNMCAF